MSEGGGSTKTNHFCFWVNLCSLFTRPLLLYERVDTLRNRGTVVSTTASGDPYFSSCNGWPGSNSVSGGLSGVGRVDKRSSTEGLLNETLDVNRDITPGDSRTLEFEEVENEYLHKILLLKIEIRGCIVLITGSFVAEQRLGTSERDRSEQHALATPGSP